MLNTVPKERFEKNNYIIFPSKSPSREDVAGPSYTGEIVSLSSDDDVLI